VAVGARPANGATALSARPHVSDRRKAGTSR
jgi:hypothetical protein